jgi:serine/threonine protein kinase
MDGSSNGNGRRKRSCTDCGATFEGEESDPCPVCTLDELAGRLGNGIGRYQIIEELGQGGQAVVFSAREKGESDRLVALKVLKPEFRDDPEFVRRFQFASERMSRLDHPNIVRVLDRSRPDDYPAFCALQPVMGGNLGNRARQVNFRELLRAARLMVAISAAMQHAHQKGVLHGDLKPANILLDHDDKPYVTDFMARRIGQTEPGVKEGTFHYAAPEQANGRGVTVETDTFGLGAILYELLTQRAPVQAESFEEVVAFFEKGGPPPPSSLVSGLPRELDEVCRTALHRDAKLRYQSAEAFSKNLERAVHRFPLLQPQTSRKRRLWLWGCRHPLLAIGALLGAVLLLLADIGTLRSLRSEEQELRAAVVRANASLANAQARAVLSAFEKLASLTAREAANPELRRFVNAPTVTQRLPILQRVYERARSFDSTAIFSIDGTILARYPEPAHGFLGRDYSFRTYHQCIRALIAKPLEAQSPTEPEICVSPAYRGESSRGIEFTLAAPIYDERGLANGYLILNRHARRTLDDIEISSHYPNGQTTALFGRRDRDRTSPPVTATSPKRLTVVAHPALFNAEERALDSKLSGTLASQLGPEGLPGVQLLPVHVRPWEEPDYVDPVTNEPRLAGFAPVGATGFIVGVSTPREAATESNQRHRQALTLYAVLLNLGFLLLGLVAVWATIREEQVPSST